MSLADSDIKALVASYRNAVEAHTRMKYALVAFPELEVQVSAPLLARAESRAQAAEVSLVAAFRGVRKDNVA